MIMKGLTVAIIISMIVLFNHVAAQSVSDFIRVDQFGYLPQSEKVAVVVDPQTGYDGSLSFMPTTTANGYEVRNAETNTVVLAGTLQAWNSGATDATSGDKAWWFDFSTLTTPGSYYVYDVGKNVRSFIFEIRDDVYADVLRAAMRMFYYNRCNHEKKEEHAGKNWVDGASFIKSLQDTQARSVTDRNNAATEKDLSGGWWDAGDYNKYVTFARSAMHFLLDAYEQNPSIWGDNYKIPESGNGIPDIIDELKWEVDWLKKMQLPNGSSLVKIGTLANSDGAASLPPSTDSRPRYYYPNACSSATISQAGMLAHAALVFQTIPGMEDYALDLKNRAELAYEHYTNNPKSDNCDNGTIQAGDADRSLDEQEQIKVQSAVYLFALTGKTDYKNFVEINYTIIKQMKDNWWGPYESDLGDALMYYTTLNDITPAVKTDILTKRLNYSGDTDLYTFTSKDPYRAYMKDYNWGSNMVRSALANINNDFVFYELKTETQIYRKRAEEILHYMHGVNPFNMVYLTNMKTYDAEKSANEIYHSWFKDGSLWDNAQSSAKGGPAPGYVPGGPNKSYTDGNGGCTLTPPCNQPNQKSYRDWNGIWPDASWSVTEPAIYYQAAYVKALSKFATLALTEFKLPEAGLVTNIDSEKVGNRFIKPNPTSGLVSINAHPQAEFQVLDLTGRNITRQVQISHLEGETQLNLRQLPDGVYLITVVEGKTRTVSKVMVNR